MKENKHSTIVLLPQSLYLTLKARAKKEKRSLSEMIRYLLMLENRLWQEQKDAIV